MAIKNDGPEAGKKISVDTVHDSVVIRPVDGDRFVVSPISQYFTTVFQERGVELILPDNDWIDAFDVQFGEGEFDIFAESAFIQVRSHLATVYDQIIYSGFIGQQLRFQLELPDDYFSPDIFPGIQYEDDPYLGIRVTCNRKGDRGSMAIGMANVNFVKHNERWQVDGIVRKGRRPLIHHTNLGHRIDDMVQIDVMLDVAELGLKAYRELQERDESVSIPEP